jgi:pyrroline-5-carboxylate reductase
MVINRQNRARLTCLNREYGVRIPENKGDAVLHSDIVVLAAKPKDIPEALRQWGPMIRADQLVISVAAGISTAFIEHHLKEGTAVIRSMPNTSCTIGLSATAICQGRWATRENMESARRLFQAIGIVVEVSEEAMDTVTGLSGSGPAYIYYMVEAMQQAGVEAGLHADIARQLTLQTLLGAAHMLMETQEEPAELRRKVTSPGGTTMAGLETLRRYQFEKAVRSAIFRAKERSKELGDAFTTTVKS